MKKHIHLLLLIALLASAFTIHNMNQNKNAILNHIALSVVSLQKSTDFYKTIVQLDSIPEPFKDNKHSWFQIGEQSQLHLIEGAKGFKEHDKSTHICFSVVSIEAFMERLEKAKIPYSNWTGDSKKPTIRPDGIKQIWLQDPDGYWVEINNDR